MKKTFPTILFVLLTASIICAQATKESSVKTAPADSIRQAVSTSIKRPDLNNLVNLTGQKAPNFVSVDMNGVEYNLEKLRGKIVVINLWATWCEPCVKEMAELNALFEKFKDKDIVFLAATDENKSFVEGFLQKNQFSYQILPDALNIIKQYSPKEKTDPITGKSRTIKALPTHIVIDREGATIKHVWGFTSQKIPELSQTIEQLLAPKNGM